MRAPVVFTLPFRVLGALWPRGGCGTIAFIILAIMIFGALSR